MNHFSEKVSFIWSVADLLRGDYKQSEYGRVILPFILLRRLDQVLSNSREAVWIADESSKKLPEALREKMLMKAAEVGFYNLSRLDLPKILQDPDNCAANLTGYLHGFSVNVRDILERFRFETQIARLESADLLYLVARKFVQIDLHPHQRHPDGSPITGDDGQPVPNVTNHEMGVIFEELIRRFSEQSNETAGEHFTPREVINLMVNLLFAEDDAALRQPGAVRTMFDPACGTGGMLSVAEQHLAGLNPEARLVVYGQELNDESYAICKADMLVKGQAADNIKRGNSFSADGLPGLQADYLISNPPFGVDWSKAAREVNDEHENLGHGGRFGAGLPRKNDGSLLFLLHMLSKMKPVTVQTGNVQTSRGGSRVAIVFNGSPLFTGGAGSGESEIRRWIIENDWLEAIVALPDQMFYNTGISTYIWLLTNRKAPERKGKVQLINGINHFRKMRKSLGDKRKELGPGDIDTLTRLYAEFQEGPEVKVFNNQDFGFHRITVERPLKLNLQASPERIARLDDERAWQNLVASKKKGAAHDAEIAAGKALQQAILQVLESLADADAVGWTSEAPSTDRSEQPTTEAPLYNNRDAFLKDLKAAAKAAKVKLPAPIQKAILSALSERDETAEVCIANGKPEPDPELRDYENVPLNENINDYLRREVLPHVPDAWVDHSKTKVGYEIPFTRHFYVYTPPRPLEVIRGEIEALEAEIQGMLGRVFD
jgi:type I restriction enzyme M protein